MHSSRLRTGRSLPYGSLCQGDPPRRNMGQEIEPPPEGTWDQAARQEMTLYRDPLSPVNRMTDASKNITLPKTSFAGGI